MGSGRTSISYWFEQYRFSVARAKSYGRMYWMVSCLHGWVESNVVAGMRTADRDELYRGWWSYMSQWEFFLRKWKNSMKCKFSVNK